MVPLGIAADLLLLFMEQCYVDETVAITGHCNPLVCVVAF